MATRVASAAVLAALLLLSPSRTYTSQAQPSAAGPQLVVILVIDQMRFDYFDRFAPLWKEGFARLRTQGAVFDRAFYPYLSTVTCAGHATISTGTVPATHGVIQNAWWQRAEHRLRTCTDDATIASVPYVGPPERIGHSARRLRVPTVGDRLRAASPQSRVVTLSMKPRSAAMLAGHGGTVTWFGDTNRWVTSTAYSAAPVPEVQAFIAANPTEDDRQAVWQRLDEPSRYAAEDDGPDERPKTGWTARFPHPLAGAPGTPEPQFYELWERSPFSDDALGKMAASLVQSMRLGQRGVVDLLGVSFSALDYAGHDFGPDSQEVQDTLVRLDRTLGRLFADLDKTVGRDRYVVGLSADHGVSAIPELRRRQGKDGGRVLNAEVKKAGEAAMVAALGPGPHVAHVEYTDVYLTDATRSLVAQKPAALQPLVDGLSRIEGVMRVLPGEGLDKKRNSADPIERAAALSYVPGESGDVIVVLEPHWISTDTSAATHGTLHPYDQHVPVMFLGASVKPGRYHQPASPADIAPTLASIIQLSMPGVDGTVLKPALK